MKEEEEEEKLKDLEFNNEEEDMVVVKEEKEKKKKDPSIIAIIVLGIIIAILAIILFVLLFTGDKKEKDNGKESGNEQQEKEKEKEKKDEDKQEEDNSPDYDAVYLNKYIATKKEVTDIDGKKITDKNNEKVYLTSDNEIYLVRKSNGKIKVRRIENGEAFNVFDDNATGLVMNDNGRTLLGVYKTDGNHDVLYLFSGTNFSTTDLKDKHLYTYSESDGGDKYIYGNRYIITAKDNLNKNGYTKFGLYDIKSNEQIIDGTYDGLEYLHDDIYVAIKGDKSGVIDKDNKVLLQIKYKSVSYLNGLYFVGSNNKIEVFDNSLKSLSSYLTVSKLNDFSYHMGAGKSEPYRLVKYNNYVVVGVLENDGIYNYTFVAKNGDQKPIGKGYVSVADNYLIKSSTEDTKIVLYDNLLNESHVLEANQSGIKLTDDEVSIFLNFVLVINGNKFFNLKTDADAGHITEYRKVNRGYEVKLVFNGQKTGTLTITKDDNVLKEVEGVSTKEFLEAENNGIYFNKGYFIYNAGGVVYAEKLQAS